MKECGGRDVVDMIKTWDLGRKSPYVADADSIKSSEMFDDWDRRARTPSLSKNPEPACVERASPPRKENNPLMINEAV